MDHRQTSKPPNNHRTFMRALRDGPLFPCGPDKTPRCEGGHTAATTDRERISWMRERYKAWGMPTGRNGVGVWVLDVDPEEGGYESLKALEERIGPLPETLTVRTPSGGEHRYYLMPVDEAIEIRNSTGGTNRLGPGLDVRGDGGYVLIPPSQVAHGAYTVLDDREPVQPTKALVEAVKKDSRKPRPSGPGRSRKTSTNVDGETVPVGTRNDWCFRRASSLRAWGYSEAEILAHLHNLNVTKLEEPLPEEELERIARSAASYPVGETATEEVRAAVDGITGRLLNGRAWRGTGGKSERDLIVILTGLAYRFGEIIPSGVRISVGFRELAILAASTRTGVSRAVARLKRDGILRSDNHNRRRGQSGALVLLWRNAHTVDTPTMGRAKGALDGESVHTLRGSVPPRLRWSSAEVRRLGKTAGALLDHLSQAPGGELELDYLGEDLLGMARPRDLLRRDGPVQRLIEAGIVQHHGRRRGYGGVLTLAADWRERLEDARTLAGEQERESQLRNQHRREQEAYAQPVYIRPDKAPSETEMRLDRMDRAGLTEEEAEILEAIRAYIATGADFNWTWHGCKPLFYATGVWPEPHQLERIRAYALDGEVRAA